MIASSIINTSTNTVVTTVNVDDHPFGIAITPDGKRVYVTNIGSDTVSVIDTATYSIIKTVGVGNDPEGVVVTPDGTRAYVANFNSNTVSVIDTSTNSVIKTIPVGTYPAGVTVKPDGTKIYVANEGIGTGTVSIIDTNTNNVEATVDIEGTPMGVTINPSGTKIYVSGAVVDQGTVYVVDTTTYQIISTVNVGRSPFGIGVTPDGRKVYVANYASDSISIIDTNTDKVVSTIPAGNDPSAFGQFMGPLPIQLIYPVANFTSNTTSGYTPLSVQFTDLSTYSLSRNWDFNGDGIIDSSEENPVYVYQNPGTYIANLTVSNENGTNSKTATINVLPAPLKNPAITWNNPADITIGTALGDTQLNAVAEDPDSGATIEGIFTYTPPAKTVLSVGNARNLHVDFTPIDSTKYNTASKDVQINVLKSTPTITWNNPIDIIAGTALGSEQLNAVAKDPVSGVILPGIYNYDPAAETVLAIGTHTLHVDFNPSNATIYNPTSAEVQINVVRAPLKTPTITWNTPADITVGKELGPEQLNAIATDPNTGNLVAGTFVYNPKEGTVLSAGMGQTLHVDFTPTDTATYTVASTYVAINVLPASLKTPTIIWRNPADITVGIALGSTQLNAAAKDPDSGDTVPGTFTYTPAAGEILDVGTHTLRVDFVPTDTETYNKASKDVAINVLERPVIPAPIINSISFPLNPVPIGTSITTSMEVTYLGDLSTLTAEWNWGDGSTSQSQISSSNFETSHVYNLPGIYTIKLTVTDPDGRSETKEAPNYVVVYDPQGGFVTGGGWINSPAGAYVSDKTLAGKATFGFVSKYEKGATVPTGKTEFQFNLANLNFHSENYDWLVVTESQAKYKGTGTINGTGNYGFMLSAVDGVVDKFRIKIWEKQSGNTIYDNEMGAGEDSDASTAISGGSIIVHKKK